MVYFQLEKLYHLLFLWNDYLNCNVKSPIYIIIIFNDLIYNFFEKNLLLYRVVFIIIMYLLELSLRYSPFPLSIQKKEFEDVKRIYDEIKSSMNENLDSSNLIQLRCDKVQDKLIAVRAKEIISVQIYEKSSVAGGAKRPGFSLNIDW